MRKTRPRNSGLVARPGRLFALKFQPPKQQRLLVVLASADDLASERVVLDPNELEPRGRWRWIGLCLRRMGNCSPSACRKAAARKGTLHFYRTDTGEALADRIPRVQYPTGGGSAAWTPDGTGIFYTRYPHAGEKPEADLNFFQQIYFHKLGTPLSADEYSAGHDFPRIAEIDFETSRDGRWVLARVANGDGGEFAHYLRDPRAGWPRGMAAGDALRGWDQGRRRRLRWRDALPAARSRTRRAEKSCASRSMAAWRCATRRRSCPRAMA